MADMYPMVHAGSFTPVRFLALDRVQLGSRCADFNKILLQRELHWTSEFEATKAPGLNEAFNLKPFLEGFSSGAWDKDS